MPAKLVVLISGNGSNMQAIIDACRTTKLPSAKVVHVISSSKKAFGLERCANANPPIPTTVHNLYPYQKKYLNNNGEHQPASPEARKHFDADLAQIILNLPEDQKPDLIVCAGYMLVFSPNFLTPIEQADIPVINLHPALPKAHDGKYAIEEAHKACEEGTETETGVMIHYVIEEVDRGEPIFIRKLPMRKGESIDVLTDRIHAIEHPSIVEGARRVLEKRHKEGKILLESGEVGFERCEENEEEVQGLKKPVNLPKSHSTAPMVPLD